MILLRPTDPDQPITIHNATQTEVEDLPEAWWRDHVAYVIETTRVEVTASG
jgi:hypothetical protein